MPNTDENCYMLNIVVVEAWAHITDRSGRFIEARTQSPDKRKYSVPCTITYNREDIK